MNPIEEPLPEWAAAKANPDHLVINQQLCTKDGRIVGNAAIVDIGVSLKYNDLRITTVTDAGNSIVYTLNELLERYYPGPFILKEIPGKSLCEFCCN